MTYALAALFCAILAIAWWCNRETKKLHNSLEQPKQEELPPPVPKEETVPSVKIKVYSNDLKNLDEDTQKELNAAVAELERMFSGPDAYASLEAFMRENSSGRSVSFITANGLNDSLSQIAEEMENHKFDTDHWNDADFLENVMSYYHQGYEFEGFEALFNKYQETKTLSEDERNKVKNWYFLAAQEIVYDV